MATAAAWVDELTDAALDRLGEAGVRATAQATDHRVRLSAGADAHEYLVEAKRSPSRASAGLVRNTSGPRRMLLVTDYVTDAVGEVLRANDIHFVDAAGNMYLHWPNLLVDIRGRRRPAASRTYLVSGRPQSTFKRAGLKVVFMFLCEPSSVALSVREAAKASGASHGTVQNVLRELEQTGYLDGRRRTLHRTHDLFEQWVEAYILNLWPTLTLGRFTAPDPMWWRSGSEIVRSAGAQWGGETASYQLNPHMRPGGAVIYAAELPRDLIVAIRLRKAEGEGNVEVRRRFWSFGEPSLVVPTPLIYADLVASADPRQHEAAASLRDRDDILRRLDHR
jgi:hypothetical protein